MRSTPTEMQSMNENDFECLAKTRVNTPPMAKMTDDGKAEIIFRGTDNEMGPEVGFEEVWNIPYSQYINRKRAKRKVAKKHRRSQHGTHVFHRQTVNVEGIVERDADPSKGMKLW